MHKDLQAFRNAVDKTTGDGRDLDKAREIADKYVKENPQEFEYLAGWDEHDVCKEIDVMRAAGRYDQVTRIEVWVRHHFEPTHVGGPASARVRVLGQ